MYLKLFDMFNIKTIGESSTIESYIENEYGLFGCSGADTSKVDLTIEFVDDISPPEEHVHIRPPVAYDKKGVFLHDPSYHTVRIDFGKIGKSGNWVTCDRNFNPHFFAIILEYMVHFNLLQQGAFYCHSSAFEVDGKGILCPAWRNVGKTNLLIAFLKDGAKYIGDDWTFVNKDGYMRSLPKRLNLLFYNFELYPELAEGLSPEFKALLQFVMQANAGKYDLNQDTLDILKKQARLRVSPYQLFNQTPQTEPVRIDYVFLLKRAEGRSTKVDVGPLSVEYLTNMLKAIVDFEQSYFYLSYQAFTAQTGKINEFLENSSSNFRNLILQAFSNGAKLREITVPSQHHAKEAKEVIEETIRCDEA